MPRYRVIFPAALLAAATPLLALAFPSGRGPAVRAAGPSVQPAPPAPPSPPESRPLPGQPALAREPQAAVDAAGNVYVAFGAGDALYCSASPDGGRTFSPAVKIGGAGKLSLGMRRGPRVAVAGRSVVVSAIYGEQGRGRDGELVAWRSLDGGRTWRGPSRVSDSPGAAREGLHAMAASPDGKTLACTWLDMRGTGTEIYLSLSRDGGATWEKNRSIYRSPDGTVCECCHPSAAFGPRGELLIMWRNWLGGARDMYLARSQDGGKTFGAAEKLGAGTWPLNACPMDGGAVAVGPKGEVATVWRRDQETFSCAPGGKEELLGRGQQGWVAYGRGGAYSAWLVGRPGRLLVRRPGDASPVEVTPGGADDPMLAAAPGGAGPSVLVWTDRSGSGDKASIRSATL